MSSYLTIEYTRKKDAKEGERLGSQLVGYHHHCSNLHLVPKFDNQNEDSTRYYYTFSGFPHQITAEHRRVFILDLLLTLR